MKLWHKLWITAGLYLVLIICTASAVGAAPASARGNVAQRFEQLRALFPDDSYFSVNGRACRHGIGGTCDNCRLSNVMEDRLGYEQDSGIRDGWTCVAFARYALYYVFGIVDDTPAYDDEAIPGMSAIGDRDDARIGDLFVWDDRHYAICLGDGTLYHANINGTNRVSYATELNYGPPSYILRADNYDALNAALN